MACELEEAIRMAGVPDLFDYLVLSLLRGIWSKEGADIDRWNLFFT